MSEKKIGFYISNIGQLGDVDTVARNPLGTRSFGDQGSEFIYLQGIGSTVIGSCVTFGTAAAPFLTALSVTTVRGPVAAALAAVLATQFGWYQIGGLASMLFNIVAATVASAVLGSVYLSRPFMNGNG